MQGDPRSGSKVREALDREICNSGGEQWPNIGARKELVIERAPGSGQAQAGEIGKD